MMFTFRWPAPEGSTFAPGALDHWIGQHVGDNELVAAERIDGGTAMLLTFQVDPDRTMMIDQRTFEEAFDVSRLRD